MTDHAPTTDPAIVSFAIDKAEREITIYNVGQCDCGNLHATRLALDSLESAGVGIALLELLRAVTFTERSVDVAEPYDFVVGVSNTIAKL